MKNREALRSPVALIVPFLLVCSTLATPAQAQTIGGISVGGLSTGGINLGGGVNVGGMNIGGMNSGGMKIGGSSSNDDFWERQRRQREEDDQQSRRRRQEEEELSAPRPSAAEIARARRERAAYEARMRREEAAYEAQMARERVAQHRRNLKVLPSLIAEHEDRLVTIDQRLAALAPHVSAYDAEKKRHDDAWSDVEARWNQANALTRNVHAILYTWTGQELRDQKAKEDWAEDFFRRSGQVFLERDYLEDRKSSTSSELARMKSDLQEARDYFGIAADAPKSVASAGTKTLAQKIVNRPQTNTSIGQNASAR